MAVGGVCNSKFKKLGIHYLKYKEDRIPINKIIGKGSKVVKVFTSNWELLGEFETCKDVGKYINMHPSNISRKLKRNKIVKCKEYFLSRNSW